MYFCDSLSTSNMKPWSRLSKGQIREHLLEVLIVDHLQNFARVKDSDAYALVTAALAP